MPHVVAVDAEARPAPTHVQLGLRIGGVLGNRGRGGLGGGPHQALDGDGKAEHGGVRAVGGGVAVRGCLRRGAGRAADDARVAAKGKAARQGRGEGVGKAAPAAAGRGQREIRDGLAFDPLLVRYRCAIEGEVGNGRRGRCGFRRGFRGRRGRWFRRRLRCGCGFRCRFRRGRWFRRRLRCGCGFRCGFRRGRRLRCGRGFRCRFRCGGRRWLRRRCRCRLRLRGGRRLRGRRGFRCGFRRGGGFRRRFRCRLRRRRRLRLGGWRRFRRRLWLRRRGRYQTGVRPAAARAHAFRQPGRRSARAHGRGKYQQTCRKYGQRQRRPPYSALPRALPSNRIHPAHDTLHSFLCPCRTLSPTAALALDRNPAASLLSRLLLRIGLPRLLAGARWRRYLRACRLFPRPRSAIPAYVRSILACLRAVTAWLVPATSMPLLMRASAALQPANTGAPSRPKDGATGAGMEDGKARGGSGAPNLSAMRDIILLSICCSRCTVAPLILCYLMFFGIIMN